MNDLSYKNHLHSFFFLLNSLYSGQMSFEAEHKSIQMDEPISHDQLALEALERRRVALEEVNSKI